MPESLRIRELLDYKVLDTPSEKELDEIAFLTSVICNKPVGLVSLVDKDRNWLKAKYGSDLTETPRSEAFCPHTFSNPDDVMIIKDALEDDRVKNSTMVLGGPGIRFYAGAPLVSPNGYVLGALCVVDTVPGDLNADQKKALKILASRVMNYLNTRKVMLNQQDMITDNEEILSNITNEAPGVLFKFHLNRQQFNLNFVSNGVGDLDDAVTPNSLLNNPKSFLDIVYSADKKMVNRKLMRAAMTQESFSFEFRIDDPDNGMQWYLAKGSAHQDRQGPVWYGTIQNITQQLEFKKAMDQISFDISHILRSPVTNLLGLSNIIEMERSNLTEEKLREYSEYIQTVSKELDMFTRNLNAIYEDKKKQLFARN